METGKALLWGGVVLLVGGIACMIAGFRERTLAAGASATPEEISLAALVARGPEGNPNIILTNFKLGENFVYEEKNFRWTKAWIPALPTSPLPGPNRPGPAVQNSRRPQALIYTTNARDEASLNQVCEGPKLRAMVTNKIDSLGGEEKRLLEQSYPGTDFSRCLIIHQGREPSGVGFQYLLIIGGGVLVVAGLGLFAGLAVPLLRGSAAPPKRRKRLPAEEEDEDPPRRKRVARRDEDEDEEEERPRRKVARRDEDEEEDERPRRKVARRDEDEEEDERPRRKAVRREDEDEPRKRGTIKGDDLPTRRRPSRDDDEDEPPRRRRPVRDED